MRVTYDKQAQAISVKFAERGVGGKCEELILDIVTLDKNMSGQITGIEILGVEAIEEIGNDN